MGAAFYSSARDPTPRTKLKLRGQGRRAERRTLRGGVAFGDSESLFPSRLRFGSSSRGQMGLSRASMRRRLTSDCYCRREA